MPPPGGGAIGADGGGGNRWKRIHPKSVEKPTSYGGQTTKFRAWRESFKSYTDVQQRGMRKTVEMIELYRKQVIGPLEAQYIAKCVGEHLGAEVPVDELLQDFYSWLCTFTEDDPLRVIMALGEQRSFESYRNIFQAATPASTQQIMSKRIRVHQPSQAKTIEEVPKAIALWKGMRR